MLARSRVSLGLIFCFSFSPCLNSISVVNYSNWRRSKCRKSVHSVFNIAPILLGEINTKYCKHYILSDHLCDRIIQPAEDNSFDANNDGNQCQIADDEHFDFSNKYQPTKNQHGIHGYTDWYGILGQLPLENLPSQLQEGNLSPKDIYPSPGNPPPPREQQSPKTIPPENKSLWQPPPPPPPPPGKKSAFIKCKLLSGRTSPLIDRG